MSTFFSQLFRPVANSEEATRKHLLWWILLRIFLMSALCTVGTLVRDHIPRAIVPPLPQTSFFLLALCLFSIASAFCLQKWRLADWKLRSFGLAQLWMDALFVALFVYGTGCSESIFTPLLILPIVAIGLILHKKGGLFLAATCTLFYAAVLMAEIYLPLPEYFRGTAYAKPHQFAAFLNLFPFYGLVFFLTALISGQMGTRLHRTQQELRKTAWAYDQLTRLYRQIFNDISTGIITTDAANRISSYNQAAALITGIAREVVMGEPLEHYFPTMAAQLTSNQGRYVCDFARPDGLAIRIGYSCAPLRTVKDPENPDDPPTTSGLSKVITMQDISQIERMEMQMREAEKLAAIGEMSAMIAHDFRNPLAAISGSAQMLSMNAEKESSQEDAARMSNTLVAIILRETVRMEKTIADFLLFARPQQPRCQWFQLRPVLEDEMARFFATNGRQANVALVWDIPVDMACWGDQGQLGMVLRQLVENAWLAVQESEAMVLIRARLGQEGDGGRELILDVCDKGPGIPKEQQEEVFTPFVSHRAKGSGLGLAIVRQLVQQHEGKVIIAEEEGYGCVVRITLPQPPLPAH